MIQGFPPIGIMGQCEVVAFCSTWERLFLEDLLDDSLIKGSQVRNVHTRDFLQNLSVQDRFLGDVHSYAVFTEFVDLFAGNACLDIDRKHHGKLIPFTAAFAI